LTPVKRAALRCATVTIMESESADSRIQAAIVNTLARELRATTGAPVALIETHISRVLLTDTRAYKIKKPVHYPFVDYSSLPVRQHFCEEELRLNRRLAPTLYLGVSRITGTAAAPQLDGAGPLLEVAVCMQRFDAGATWSEQLADGNLQARHVDRLAARLAAFHTGAEQAAAGSTFGNAATRRATALNACAAVAGAMPEAAREKLLAWLNGVAYALAPQWEDRRARGFVRECHGDLHLHNLLVIGDDAQAFDGIEFNESLRWIDVIDDIAFAVMDLLAHGRRDFAARLLDGWLQDTGDHEALPLLPFAIVYRALVRAEVAALQSKAQTLARYMAAAQSLAFAQPAPRLLLMHGLPGSGKTFISQRLLETTGAVRLRSDVERKRLAGLAPLDDTRERAPALYDERTTARTYAELLARARIALAAGYPVILDAAYLKRAQRDAVAEMARDLRLPVVIVDCQAPLALLRERVGARRARGGDASEADVAVLERLAEVQELLQPDEAAPVITVDTAKAPDIAAVDAAWRAGAAASA
jgi:aminoglycoside phosphotransferase family enzyme/predicted kinase